MKQAYKTVRFNARSRDLLIRIDKLITEYVRAGYMLSVRQLYYQLVARGVIENTERSYKNIASLINDGREAGMLDWDAIEDRGRSVETRASWDSGQDILNATARSFHMDMWVNQPRRVFVVVEKAALAGVLGRVCRQMDVPLLAAKGYPSSSIVRSMALEHFDTAINTDQRVLVLHLGDHDPSGIDMTRDLQERFEMFLGHQDPDYFYLQRIALSMEQIEEKNPPPNPAKLTDSRIGTYMREYGNESWELDALEPSYLTNLVQTHINFHVDPDAWKKRLEEIEAVREKLTKIAQDFEE